MPHVSKRLLDRKKFQDIHSKLFKIITRLSYSDETGTALSELLTKTEKLMLAKRLAIIGMLDQGESIYAIEQALKVSPSTVARMSVAYERGDYRTLLREIRREGSLWDELKKIIPPRAGRDRFKNFLQF